MSPAPISHGVAGRWSTASFIAGTESGWLTMPSPFTSPGNEVLATVITAMSVASTGQRIPEGILQRHLRERVGRLRPERRALDDPEVEVEQVPLPGRHTTAARETPLEKMARSHPASLAH
jgi:hypothetical protein